MRYVYLSFAALFLSTVVGTQTDAWADDWVAVRLRGEVAVFSNDHWIALSRGDVVASTAPVRTGLNGNVEFTRDQETISLGPNTQIQIYDRTGKRFTTVREFYGTVAVEANVKNVQHFSVQTPFMAALVKGTVFTVQSGPSGSNIEVQRGRVAVSDEVRGLHSVVTVNQSATASVDKPLSLTGVGVLSAIVNEQGKIVARSVNSAANNPVTISAPVDTPVARNQPAVASAPQGNQPRSAASPTSDDGSGKNGNIGSKGSDGGTGGKGGKGSNGGTGGKGSDGGNGGSGGKGSDGGDGGNGGKGSDGGNGGSGGKGSDGGDGGNGGNGSDGGNGGNGSDGSNGGKGGKGSDGGNSGNGGKGSDGGNGGKGGKGSNSGNGGKGGKGSDGGNGGKGSDGGNGGKGSSGSGGDGNGKS